MHIMFPNTRATFIITTDITIYGEAETGFIRLFTEDRGRRLLRLWYRFYLRYFRVRLQDLQDRLQDLRDSRDLQDRLQDLRDSRDLQDLRDSRDLQDRLQDLRDHRPQALQDRLQAEAGIAAGIDIDNILKVSLKS